MADKTTTTNNLVISVESIRTFGDKAGQKRTINFKLPNPRSNLTETEIKTATTPLLTKQGNNSTPFWTDPDTGQAMSDAKILSAYTESVTTIEYDIGVDS